MSRTELHASLESALEHAAHQLPAQPPLRAFVHHNTLHAYEHLPFERAVVEAGERLGAEPWEREAAFAAHLGSGRILPRDLDAVLAAEGGSDAPIFEGGPSVRRLRRLRLGLAREWPEGPALRWLLDEGGLLDRLDAGVTPEARRALLGAGAGPEVEAAVVRALWASLSRVELGPRAPRAAGRAAIRPRDRALEQTGVDLDALVQPVLRRVAASFVDQGLAYWAMPGRERGLWPAFRALYALPLGPPDPWMATLPARLAALGDEAEEVVLGVLAEWKVSPSRWSELIEAELLALRGWAGLIHQLELRPDRAPVWPAPARLMDHLAVQLVLESVALAHLDGASSAGAPPEPPRVPDPLALAWEAVVLAQHAGVGPEALRAPARARAWIGALLGFPDLERRRLWHAAYERRHRVPVLDALLAHDAAGPVASRPIDAAPTTQILFCIDDREESMRRHVEELRPDVDTFGVAGFFGVPMAWRGIEDVRPTPLCPVVIRPRHEVRERRSSDDEGAGLDPARRALGQLRRGAAVGSRTLVRGGLLASLLGWLAMLPLVGRSLFPRGWVALRRRLRATAPAPTRLVLERAPDAGPNADGLLPGFTVEEMGEIVQGVLRTIALDRAAPLVLVLGHGSSSENNPHEAAYDCGATGGGHGGPNARVFAAMANHEGVRAWLSARGRPIPPSTWFVGGEHDTCTDEVVLLDRALVPDAHRERLAALEALLLEAGRRNAHERARRFESAPLGLTVEAALDHVRGRAGDLAQPRPELGHATNAVCFVGRRARTRGLFMDRRAFLVSYDPEADADGAVLSNLLQAVGPVGAGINLEYYFSRVDPVRYGSGTKLPHNIVGLLGVMDGHASDLRTGLPWQMVEVHEPVRLLTIVEAEPERVEWVASQRPDVARLVVHRWIQLVAWSPSSGRMFEFTGGGFVPYEPESRALPVVRSSAEHYRGARDHLGCARVEAAS